MRFSTRHRNWRKEKFSARINVSCCFGSDWQSVVCIAHRLKLNVNQKLRDFDFFNMSQTQLGAT